MADVRETAWWKQAVVYQIYPRSFSDSNGDGIGDLPGITARLDYLKTLGVDVIWLSPHFDSPNADNGYDIRDYRKVMSEFGTMADFDRMLAGMKARGMRLIIDLVVNHTSDEHAWFVESRGSRDNPKRDYYIWRDGRGEAGERPPNNYPSFFGGPAWKRDDSTGQYYLHYFAEKQPDLNWENPEVRAEVFDLMRFWLDKGVSGFRMDVIPFISKQPGLPDLAPEQIDHPEFVYASGPRIHEYLQTMHREVLAPYDAMSVGEAFGVDFEQAPLFTDARRGELSMIFHFDIVRLDRDNWRKTDWTLPQLKATYTTIDRTAGAHGWNTSFLCNHDNPRAVSHFGDDDPAWHARSAKALATLMLTQRATPFLYQGDELGMTNYPFERIEQYDDVEVKGLWRTLVETGRVPAAELLAHLRQTSRDHARTPMQWSADAHGGFTTGTPWLAVNPNHREINAAAQLGEPDSVYHHHRRLIELRHRTPALVYGAYADIDPEHPRVFAYTRTLDDERYLVLINFGREPVTYALPPDIRIADTLIDNGAGASTANGQASVSLAGWQATVYRLH
ncbi:oligo-1,6-glucosidase [Plasticicumulans lactativorans]|uniref:Oligo-1,6-glucosidase n=1 Tax=Plasticicumulans lactativorans TaxID=1133106 RepID=A0A4R2L4A1_9GAMM|nr:alpha-glucosidase [Plasticicumulans lactativorans]TCO81266.1 oligo-1,6-glucosidase [Plasticicumulans lactativorans]